MLELSWNTQMLVSSVILAVTFVGIFTEGVHGFHRAKFALAGAVIRVIAGQIFGFYTMEQALESIDWNVVFLLGCMMTIVAIMLSTGGFDVMAFKIAELSKGRLFTLLVLLGSAVTVLSFLLDNVTTVVIFGPLIVLICQALKVNPIPYLLAAALLSDTGGVATLVGDPPNLMIGSAAGIDFNTFVVRMAGPVALAWVGTLFTLRLMFRRELAVTPQPSTFDRAGLMKDKKTWYGAVFVLLLMVVLFVFHSALHWEASFVSAIGLTLLLFISNRVDMDHTLQQVEVVLLMFFISLFIVVGGVQNSHFLQYLGQFIEPFVRSNLMLASILLMWFSAILSAMIDNIPFTAAMVPIILGMQAQGIEVTSLWWALAIGVGMGGNGTHLGSTANVFIVTLSERLARERQDPSLRITPGLWFKKGTPAMIVTLLISSLVMWLFFDFFAAPIS